MTTATTPRAATCRRCDAAFAVPHRRGVAPHLCPSCRAPKPALVPARCRICAAPLFPNERGVVLCGRCRGTVHAARLCLKALVVRKYIEVVAPGVYAIRPGAMEIAELLAVETGIVATVERDGAMAA